MPRTNSSSPHARGLLGLVAVTTPRFPPARQLPRVGVGFRHGKLLEAQQARSYFSRIRSWTPPIVLPGHTRRLCRRFNGGGGKGVEWIRAPEQPLRQHQRVRVEQAGPHQSYAFTYHQVGKTKESDGAVAVAHMEIVTSAEYCSRVSSTLTEFRPMVLLALAMFKNPCATKAHRDEQETVVTTLVERGTLNIRNKWHHWYFTAAYYVDHR